MSKSEQEEGSASQYAYLGLDRFMHERARLSVLTSLAAHPARLRFSDLKQLCALTDGNLSRHAQVLQGAGLIGISKSLKQSRPQTLCRSRAEGRKRYIEYLSVLEQVVRDAVAAITTQTSRRVAADLLSRVLE